MKTIVTHHHPDQDAITSTWLVKRYLPEWSEATIAFVSAGETLRTELVDEDPDIIHVDTGLGKFDHHQTGDHISASHIVLKYLLKNNHIQENEIEALEHMIKVVTDIDHFSEADYPEPTADWHEFSFWQIVEGLNFNLRDSAKVAENGFIILDAILSVFKSKVAAQKEIEQGYIFESKWGKSLALETNNEETMKFALKAGYGLVLRRDPVKGNIRIKALPKAPLGLDLVHKKLERLDPHATWFLHSSKKILLNGSSKNSSMTATTLPLKKVIEIIKKI